MTKLWASVALLTVAIAAGTLSDRPIANPTVEIAGYRVLAADFHTHSSMFSDGALTPWGLVLEAERHGLDAIAVTGHNQVSDGQLGRWFSRAIGGPIVLGGQEIITPTYHMIAAGIETKISFLLSPADAIDAIHRQGGIAIAAHPTPHFAAGFDDEAVRKLDGAEICHPAIYGDDRTQQSFERFAARAPMAAIGSSDYHGLGEMGVCRTFVFVREVSTQGILDAVRAHRTVVYGLGGRAYGDPQLVRAAEADGRLRGLLPSNSRGTSVDWFGRITGILGLALLLAFASEKS